MKLPVCRVYGVVLISAAAVSAPAQAFYDNFGAGNSYNVGSGWTISATGSGPGYFSQGFQFTSALTGQLGSIAVGMLHVAGANNYEMDLWNDSANSPGSLIGSWFGTAGIVGTNPPPFTISISSGPTLNSGTVYWLTSTTVAVDTQGFWGFNSVGATGFRSLRQSPTGAWTTFSGSSQGAFRLVAVPEPTSTLALGTGLLLALRRRRQLH